MHLGSCNCVGHCRFKNVSPVDTCHIPFCSTAQCRPWGRMARPCSLFVFLLFLGWLPSACPHPGPPSGSKSSEPRNSRPSAAELRPPLPSAWVGGRPAGASEAAAAGWLRRGGWRLPAPFPAGLTTARMRHCHRQACARCVCRRLGGQAKAARKEKGTKRRPCMGVCLFGQLGGAGWSNKERKKEPHM